MLLSPPCSEDRVNDFSSYDFAKQPPFASSRSRSRSSSSRVFPIHGRSKSAPLDDEKLPSWWDVSTPCYKDWAFIERKKRKRSRYSRRLALEQDIRFLQIRLEEEQAIRVSLEKALVSASSSFSPGGQQIAPRTQELIAETALLEHEVAHLEQLVVSLHQKLHLEQIPPVVLTPDVQKKQRRFRSPWKRQNTNPFSTEKWSPAFCDTKSKSSFSGRLHSFEQSPKVQATKETRASPLHHLLGAIHPRDKKLSDMPTLDNIQHLSSLDIFLGNANELSEQLVKCMVGIYFKLADTPSSQTLSPMRMNRVRGGLLSNPFQVKELLGDVGAYRFMLEVPLISVGKDQLAYAAYALQEFKSMVKRLSTIDVTVMKLDEKLAFWINVYNALVMHAYLAYGLPTNRLKRASLLQKAAYKVGTCSINAHCIEQEILGSRAAQTSGQWLQALLSPLAKLKATDERRGYALSSYEPLVCFALSSGARSDPSVRVYTAKGVREQLEIAKTEFLQASVGVSSGDKVVLPKMLEAHLKDVSMNNSRALVDWLCRNLPQQHCSRLQECLNKKGRRRSTITSNSFEWLPFDSSFRYIFAKDDSLI